jgi:hypothetical protein
MFKMLVIAVAIATSASKHGYYDGSAVVSPYWVGKIHAGSTAQPS